MSDQDFFFDEEDEKPAKESKPAKKSAPAKKPAAKASSGSSASFWEQTVTTSVTGLVAAIALLLGVIVGIVLPVGDTGGDVPAPTNGGAAAPALTPEQLESGSLPEGHPPLEQMTGGSTEPTGAETTTTP